MITGNWGTDLALLVKAAAKAARTASSTPTTPARWARRTAIGEAGVGRVKVVSYYGLNDATQKEVQYLQAFKKKFGATEDPYTRGHAERPRFCWRRP